MRPFDLECTYGSLIKAGMPPIDNLTIKPVAWNERAMYAPSWELNGVCLSDKIAESLIEMQVTRWLCGLQYITDRPKDQQNQGRALVHEISFGDELLGGYRDIVQDEEGTTQEVFVATGAPSGLYANIKLYTALNYEGGTTWYSRGVYLDAIWSECGIIDAAIELLRYVHDNRLTIFTGATDKV